MVAYLFAHILWMALFPEDYKPMVILSWVIIILPTFFIIAVISKKVMAITLLRAVGLSLMFYACLMLWYFLFMGIGL